MNHFSSREGTSGCRGRPLVVWYLVKVRAVEEVRGVGLTSRWFSQEKGEWFVDTRDWRSPGRAVPSRVSEAPDIRASE